MKSLSSVVHGLFALAMGMAAIFSPAMYWQVLGAVSGAVGFPVPNALLKTSPLMMAIFGVFMTGFGTAHTHAGMTSAHASVGMICSEFWMAGLASYIAFANNLPFLYFVAACTAVFGIWGALEHYTRPKAKVAASKKA